MTSNKRLFFFVLTLSFVLTFLYYTLIPRATTRNEDSTGTGGENSYFRHRTTKYGRYCIEENICKTKFDEETYVYTRVPNFSEMLDSDINTDRNISHAGRVVPNVVHYTWYGGVNFGNVFRFHQMMAVLSAHKILKPKKIYFWHQQLPSGEYWNLVKQKVPELCPVYRKPPKTIRGQNVGLSEYVADIVRLEILIEYGGMYFDLDVIVLKDLSSLLTFDLTIGYESQKILCNGTILARPHSDFLKVWHKSYKVFRDWNRSSEIPEHLAKRHPNLVHTENASFYTPGHTQLELLYGTGTLHNWRKQNYICHLLIRYHKVEHNDLEVRTWNTTVGEIFRWILYDDWKIWTGESTKAKRALCVFENMCRETNASDVYIYRRKTDFLARVDFPVKLEHKRHHEGMVPNFVHITWYGGKKKGNMFRFHHLIAVLAIAKFVKPKFVFFWHDMVPEGDYWTEVRQKVPEIIMVYRKAPNEIRGRKVMVAEHLTDVVRLEVLLEYGGMYFDLDAIVVKPVRDLLKYDVTMGYEDPGALCNGIIFAKPWADFLKLWHREYKVFDDSNWGYHSVILPGVLAKTYPHLVHTENTSFNRPNYKERAWLYTEGKLYDWRKKNFVVHLWIRFHKTEHDPVDIKTWNTTAGEIFRFVYYGDWKMKRKNETRGICLYGNLCKEKKSERVYKWIQKPDFITKIDSNLNLSVNIVHKERVVPKIVHFAWYGGYKRGNTFRFHHLISILAAHKFVKPEKILFWHDLEPEGHYWQEVNQKVPELTLIYRKSPQEIRGRKVAVAEHLTDVVRLEAVIEYGGAYFDLDAIVVKPLEPLLKYDVSMGYETQDGLCNGVIIAKPWAEFLRVWHKQYNTFDDRNWAYHSVKLPAFLAKQHPGLVHTEARSMHRPNWMELSLLYDQGNLYDWRSHNYILHLWIRMHKTEHNPDDIKTLNTTVGEIFRHIYYNDWRIMK